MAAGHYRASAICERLSRVESFFQSRDGYSSLDSEPTGRRVLLRGSRTMVVILTSSFGCLFYKERQTQASRVGCFWLWLT